MIVDKVFYTEEGKGNLDIARRVLVTDFGLVLPTCPMDKEEATVLVWCDPKEFVARYRVHFLTHANVAGFGFCDAIGFKYWLRPDRMKREILEQDPMGKAMDKVKQELVGNVIEYSLCGDVSIDKVLIVHSEY